VRFNHSAALDNACRRVLSAPLVDSGKGWHGQRY
jgi:hypothetical protein